MMPATTVGAALRPLVTRVLGLAAICAIAVSAGCGSPSLPTSTNTPARQLTGSMDDWGAAVCKYGRYRQYSLIPVPTWMCSGNPGGGGFTTLLFIFEFRDQSEMRAHPEDWGHRYSYASCTSDDGRITVFVSDVSGIGSKGEAAQLTNESIQPLTRFGCTITQNDPYQSPSTPEQIPQPQPPPQPLPGSTNAMPPPTGMPPAPGNSTSQYVRTESGKARCVVQPDQVACEASGPGSTGFRQAPITMPESQCKYSPCPGGMHSDLAEVTASGAFDWKDGNIGGVGSDWEQTDTTLDYGQTYHISGWTVLPSSDGTRFTNDGSGHGMSVSIENVSTF
jgi:hypothetical protein